jgi:antitoxin (DNA-binding transcriptional repressor) of toxin-antitoxin stability system
LLERVARGEEVVITRRAKPVARIIPEGRPAIREIQQAVHQLRALRREIAKRKGFRPLTVGELRRSIDEGRP